MADRARSKSGPARGGTRLSARATFALGIALALAAAGCGGGERGVPGGRWPADSLGTMTRNLHHETADCVINGEPCLRLDLSYPILLHVPSGDTLALNR
ncbi:MAG: hypothetical protein ABI960_05885 [Candidatus Eisenbacteria bacterium]